MTLEYIFFMTVFLVAYEVERMAFVLFFFYVSTMDNDEEMA